MFFQASIRNQLLPPAGIAAQLSLQKKCKKAVLSGLTMIKFK